jgi:uncharacterized damage-inducible protein DinB
VADSDLLLAHFRRQRGWTRDLVAAVPEERFDWSPGEGAFGAGQLVRHLLQSEIFWRKMLQKALDGEVYDPFSFEEGPGAGRMRSFRSPNLRFSADSRLGSTFADLLTAWTPIQAETEALIGGLTTEQLATVRLRHPLTGFEASLHEFVLVMLEHEAHHRGQLSAYMKVLALDQPTTLWT